ncbi:UNVERIFIED_CONTAM: hypothetical protein Sangu_2511100 [Sesamum angustifolium]|uniref:Uncharacterized protein n=1 Tax=Sesamum angustifolium TaxID=2727405 RepID=A0AAW2JL91_9LAMI
MRDTPTLWHTPTCLLGGLSRAIPAPLSIDVDDPSTYKLHISVEMLVSSYTNSTTKSTNTCALIADIGQNSMPNSLNSTAHLIILPESSGLTNTCFKEWFAKTITW